MSLFDELLSLQAPKGPSCGVGIFLEGLPEGLDRDEVVAVVMNPAIRYATLANWAKSKGATVGADSFSRHRKGECGCGRAR